MISDPRPMTDSRRELEEVKHLIETPEAKEVEALWKQFNDKFETFTAAHPLKTYFWQIMANDKLWVGLADREGGDEEE